MTNRQGLNRNRNREGSAEFDFMRVLCVKYPKLLQFNKNYYNTFIQPYKRNQHNIQVSVHCSFNKIYHSY